jgi:hypothetical protein
MFIELISIWKNQLEFLSFKEKTKADYITENNHLHTANFHFSFKTNHEDSGPVARLGLK